MTSPFNKGTFKKFIVNFLKLGKLSSKMCDEMTDEKNIKLFEMAFTSPSVNKDCNYESFEHSGDKTVNKFIVMFIKNKWPFLRYNGVDVVSRCLIKYGSKDTLSSIADKLGFWEHILATDIERGHRKKPLLEDTFESIFGAIEDIIDSKKGPGVGFSVCYRILYKIFNNPNLVKISLAYNNLFDPKTRLKEIFDRRHSEIGFKLKYKTEYNDGKFYCTVQNFTMKPASACLKINAEKEAAKIALCILESKGIQKVVPDIYKQIEKMYLS